MKPTIDEQALLDSAIEEFTRFNYQAASLNRILQRANIQKGSFYYRFKGKYELYLHLIKVGLDKKQAFIASAMQGASTVSEDIFEMLQSRAELSYEFAALHPHYYELAKRFSGEKENPIYHKVLKDLSLPTEDALSIWVGELYDKGAFDTGYSKDFVQKLILALFTRFDEIFFTDNNYDLEMAKSYLKQTVQLLKQSLSATSR